MKSILAGLRKWNLDIDHVRRQMYRAPTPRERERWHALWLAAQGLRAVQIAGALDRNPHTVGSWLTKFRKHGPASLAFDQTGGPPRSQQGPTGAIEGGSKEHASGSRDRTG